MAFNLSSLLGGLGAAGGSLIAPGIGTALGAGAGSLIGSLFGGRSSRNNLGSPQNPQLMNNQGGYQFQEMPGGSTAVREPRFEGDQLQILKQLLPQAFQGMQGLPGGDQLPQASFGPIKEAAMSDFYQNIVPGIAERFTGAGAGGQRSSAFQQSLGGAGAGLAQRLAGMEQGFNVQQRGQALQERGQDISRLLSMLQLGLQPRSQTHYTDPQPSLFGGLMGGLGQGLGTAGSIIGGNYLSNKLGL